MTPRLDGNDDDAVERDHRKGPDGERQHEPPPLDTLLAHQNVQHDRGPLSF